MGSCVWSSLCVLPVGQLGASFKGTPLWPGQHTLGSSQSRLDQTPATIASQDAGSDSVEDAQHMGQGAGALDSEEHPPARGSTAAAARSTGGQGPLLEQTPREGAAEQGLAGTGASGAASGREGNRVGAVGGGGAAFGEARRQLLQEEVKALQREHALAATAREAAAQALLTVAKAAAQLSAPPVLLE
jgi:hypothetical protein